ncbi:MAG: hypothetical protein M1825_006272 [Sarcosagium campestre]|nr:MAG: hypothetical protein M1825_006272 [Sarcosagium campestre]
MATKSPLQSSAIPLHAAPEDDFSKIDFAKDVMAAVSAAELLLKSENDQTQTTAGQDADSSRQTLPGLQRPERKGSLRHANSVELTHKRMKSGDSGTRATGPDLERSAAAREGRNFTVANVGNNGRIFLKPAMRQAPRRAPSNTLSFSPAPAQSKITSDSHLQIHFQPSRARRSSEATLDSLWSGTRTPHTTHRSRHFADLSSSPTASASSPPPLPRIRHHRAQSFSTIGDNAKGQEAESGSLSGGMVRANQRPRTADRTSAPALEVLIPNYRLGIPRFSVRGTAFLSSIYTQASTIDDFRNSNLSQAELDKLLGTHPAGPSTSALPRPNPLRSHTTQKEPLFDQSPPLRHRSGDPIVPRIFDALTFSPWADDLSVVRFSETGSINAAIPARLVAQITSADFLDYDLLSDFFLTFRAFMQASDLVAYLLARLEWAALRKDEVGKIVRVRTFVAVRHWILNYFIDDFVPNYPLRQQFCDSVNRLCESFDETPDVAGRGGCKIAEEMKKCWRRTCALYWDEIDADAEAGAEAGARDAIQPGGIVLENADDHSNVTTHAGRQPIDAVPPQFDMVVARVGAAFDADGEVQVSRSPNPALSSQIRRHSSALNRALQARALSPESDFSSVQVLSCSVFPSRSFRRHAAAATAAGSHQHFAARPVLTGPAAAASTTQPAKPPQESSHKRSGSFSDALRDHRSPLRIPKPANQKEAQPQLNVQYSGSLIRGNLMPPATGSELAATPSTPTEEIAAQEFPFAASNTAVPAQDKLPSTATPAMRKLFGTVKRALGGPGMSVGLEASRQDSTAGSVPAPVTKSALPTASTHPVAVMPSPYRLGPDGHTRTDLLANMAADSYRSAMEAPEPAAPYYSRSAETPRQTRPSTYTMSSKSIVIINDTEMPPLPPMSMALDRHRDRLFGNIDVANRNSEAEQRHVSSDDGVRRGVSLDQMRPSMPRTYRNTVAGQRSRSSTLRSPEMMSMHSRGPSAVSSRPDSLRRYASYQSGMTRHATVRSFDATTIGESDTDRADSIVNQTPHPMLRRRPGGDLRAAHKVTDLHQVKRVRSAGSLTVRSGSIIASSLPQRGSVVASSSEAERSPEQRRRFSVGALADADKDAVSLLHTHSSQPNLRASFESEVARLAQLPDDDEDGGIESTLLKLEGKFERRASDQSVGDATAPSNGLSQERSPHQGLMHSEFGQLDGVDHQLVSDVDSSVATPSLNDASLTMAKSPVSEGERAAAAGSPAAREHLFSTPEKDRDSYNSVPLLERGLSPRSRRDSNTTAGSPFSVVQTPPKPGGAVFTDGVNVSQPSFDYLHPTKGDMIRRRSTVPDDEMTQESFLLDEDDDQPESFLLDDDEDLSDSSEISIHYIAKADDDQAPQTFPNVTSATVVSDLGAPHRSPSHPPSPPHTGNPQLDVAADAQRDRVPNGPPTPSPSPVFKDAVGRANGHQDQSNGGGLLLNDSSYQTMAPRTGDGSDENYTYRNIPRHLPFVLAYPSKALAEQLTLLERDALNEVDWSQLVELRSKGNPPDTRNWAEFLRKQEANGVELVIARFNLVVKWTLSEVVMTRHMEERARTISKFIHVAWHARKLRNFATMYQIATGLLSADCQRLKKTWQLVSATDRQTLKDLQSLVQPIRNFHNLRVEMETVTVEDGCIPFLGVYIHDLAFNAQRPATIEGFEGAESLINFERYRRTASIVKNVLRLLEASSKYRIQPIEGITDRCLWLAALSDNDIRSRSKQLEQIVVA